jgi:legumain
LHKNGIPDSNIIVMMYDDIADSLENKEKGKVFNEPNGPDVYAGVPKDYVKSAVTPKNFLKILAGACCVCDRDPVVMLSFFWYCAGEAPSEGSGKVLNSGPNDRVFIYFADHGASV